MPSPVRLISLATAVPPFVLGQEEVMAEASALFRGRSEEIAPTLAMYERTDMAFATAYYHWFFLIQPFDLPERLIGADPDFYLEKKIGKWSQSPGPTRRAGAILCHITWV